MFILYDNEMNKLDFPDGVKPLDIFISSINKERETSRVEGSHLKRDNGFIYGERNIELDLWMKAHDTEDYRLLRDEASALFDRVGYIPEEYQKGKRYKVNVDDQYIPERIEGTRLFAEAKIVCTTDGLPFAESIGTTALIDKNGVSANDALWGYGMGIISNVESKQYTHTSSTFRIYNAGNMLVHPFEQDLKIEISGVTGKNFEMRNVTTGDVFKVTDTLKYSDVVNLDGPEIKINGLQALRKTNRKFISLASGWNEFRLNRTAKTKFDFRYYYV